LSIATQQSLKEARSISLVEVNSRRAD